MKKFKNILLPCRLFWQTYLINILFIGIAIISLLIVTFAIFPSFEQNSSAESASIFYKKVIFLLGLIFLMLIFFLTWLFMKRIVKPIEKLHMGIDLVIKGNYSHHIESSDRSEIGHLTNRFNQMVRSLKNSRSELNKKEEMLQSQKDFLRNIIDLSPNFIFARNTEGIFTLANKQMAELYGLAVDQMIGKKEKDFNSNVELVKQHFNEDIEVIRTKKKVSIPVYKISDIKGNDLWIQAVKFPLLTNNGEVEEIICVANDITERMEREEFIKHQAYHDYLTELPNRVLFEKKLEMNLHGDLEKNRDIAIMVIDLDGFKNINDSLGHSYGDMLLKIVARRLEASVNDKNEKICISRMGGDEFTVLVTDVDTINQVKKIASDIICEFNKPFYIDDIDFHVTASVGISVYPTDGSTAETLIKNADTAMYEAKKRGKNQYQFYLPKMGFGTIERLEIESLLRKALQNNELSLYYQPKSDLNTGEIKGMEALLRWNNDKLGMVSPSKFIPIAEDSGLIYKIGEWVLKEACRQNKEWQKSGYPPLRVAVNLSMRQLIDQDILRIINEALDKTGLDPCYLELEVTESAMMDNEEKVIDILGNLKEKGIYISIDDFGTGYSSLNYLKRLPVNALKIDRTFVMELGESESDQAIIQGTIAMAHSLNLKVIAEGVEEEKQLKFLQMRNCDEIQGFLVSKPLSVGKFTEGLEMKWNKQRVDHLLKGSKKNIISIIDRKFL